MRALAGRSALILGLLSAAAGAAHANQSYSFVVPSGEGFIELIWPSFIPANSPQGTTPLFSEGNFLYTDDQSFYFSDVVFAGIGGTPYISVAVNVGSFPTAVGQYNINSFLLEFLDSSGNLQKSTLDGGTLNIGDFPGPIDSVPEPGTYALLALGLAAMAVQRRRSRRA